MSLYSYSKTSYYNFISNKYRVLVVRFLSIHTQKFYDHVAKTSQMVIIASTIYDTSHQVTIPTKFTFNKFRKFLHSVRHEHSDSVNKFTITTEPKIWISDTWLKSEHKCPGLGNWILDYFFFCIKLFVIFSQILSAIWFLQSALKKPNWCKSDLYVINDIWWKDFFFFKH